MTGFLHRMAARALGAAPVLAPRAPSLFEPVADDLLPEPPPVPPSAEVPPPGVARPREAGASPVPRTLEPPPTPRASLAAPASPRAVDPATRGVQEGTAPDRAGAESQEPIPQQVPRAADPGPEPVAGIQRCALPSAPPAPPAQASPARSAAPIPAVTPAHPADPPEVPPLRPVDAEPPVRVVQTIAGPPALPASGGMPMPDARHERGAVPVLAPAEPQPPEAGFLQGPAEFPAPQGAAVQPSAPSAIGETQRPEVRIETRSAPRAEVVPIPPAALAATAASPLPPTVEIRIGTVEIRASPPPAAPPADPQRISLDDFLAGRGGR